MSPEDTLTLCHVAVDSQMSLLRKHTLSNGLMRDVYGYLAADEEAPVGKTAMDLVMEARERLGEPPTEPLRGVAARRPDIERSLTGQELIETLGTLETPPDPDIEETETEAPTEPYNMGEHLLAAPTPEETALESKVRRFRKSLADCGGVDVEVIDRCIDEMGIGFEIKRTRLKKGQLVMHFNELRLKGNHGEYQGYQRQTIQSTRSPRNAVLKYVWVMEQLATIKKGVDPAPMFRWVDAHTQTHKEISSDHLCKLAAFLGKGHDIRGKHKPELWDIVTKATATWAAYYRGCQGIGQQPPFQRSHQRTVENGGIISH
jgi:hypothetical protein